MAISRTTVLAGTLLVSGVWLAASHHRASAETTAVEAKKDRVDDQANKQKDRIDDQASADKTKVEDRAKADKARVDNRADAKKAAIDRGEKGAEPTAGVAKADTSKKDGVGDEVSDSWITTKVKASFVGDKKLKGSDIHVDTDHNGIVVLSGYVKTDLARAHAISVARETKGVHEVKDELRLTKEK